MFPQVVGLGGVGPVPLKPQGKALGGETVDKENTLPWSMLEGSFSTTILQLTVVLFQPFDRI